MNMAEKNSFCLDEEELSCPICFEEFNLCEKNRHPKLLLCLHTFCLACVETLRKYDGSLQCSICRTSHHVYTIGDLMDNYVIFEHLRMKQESDDEKLATQLKEEYETSERLLREQEERDAQLARAEYEKNKLEEDRRRKEEEEKESLRLEELRRQAVEEMNRRDEARRREEEEEIQRRSQEAVAQLNYPPLALAYESPEEVESSSESLDMASEETTGSENEDSEEEEDDDSFQDLDGAQNENGDQEADETSIASVADLEDYETLSSDDSEDEHCSTEIISSDDEDEMGTALSTTAPLPSRNQHPSADHSPSTSPEPDLLSEEFSGVAQPHPLSKPPQETLDMLLPAVKCAEKADGSIIILDSSMDEASTETGTPSPRNAKKIIFSEFTLSTTDESEEDPANYSSEEERDICLTRAEDPRQKAVRRERRVSAAAAAAQENDENCKLQ